MVRTIRADSNLFREFRDTELLLDVFGQVDDDGARPAAVGDIERFCENFRNVLCVKDQIAVLDNGPGDTDYVNFLECVLTD